MKGNGKLRLVTPPGSDGDDEDLAPTPEELRAAEDLRRALDGGEDALGAALGAAWAPEERAARAEPDLEAILQRALGDEAATTALEVAAGERLHEELLRDEAQGDLATTELARALRAAAHPRPIDPARHEALLRSALDAIPLRVRRRVESVRRIAPAAAATLMTITALAAGVTLILGRPAPPPSAAATASVASLELARPRSTDDLFDAATPFPRRGQESARVDRILAARSGDLRKNRFAAWGVR